MPRLSNIERERSVGLLLAGTSQVGVARIFGCSRITIAELWRRFLQTGSIADRQRSGRSREELEKTGISYPITITCGGQTEQHMGVGSWHI